MRASNTKRLLDQEELRQMTEEALRSGVRCIRELADGFFNAAYLVELEDGRRVVLKVAPTGPVLRQEKGIMRVETLLMRWLERHCPDVPAPRVLAEGERLSPYFFMDYIEGEPLDRRMAALTPEAWNWLYRQLGALVARLHQVHPRRFGSLVDPAGQFELWSQAFGRMVEDILLDARDFGAQLPPEAASIPELVGRLTPVLDQVERPTLLHRDLWMGNIFLERDALGILALTDWERAVAGDPLMEFCFAFLEGPGAVGCRAEFYRAYGRPEQLEEGEGVRVQLYLMYMLLLLLVEGYARDYRDEAAERQVSAQLVDALQALARAAE